LIKNNNNDNSKYMNTHTVKKVVRGDVEGELLVNPGAFSFMGDVDLETAEIIAKTNPNYGKSISGKILVFEETKGSSGGSLVLMTLANQGKGPAAIISVKAADFNLTEGAILAGMPYASNLDKKAFDGLKSGYKAVLKIDDGILNIID
jgi:predicted aconitase with swiveling domain